MYFKNETIFIIGGHKWYFNKSGGKKFKDVKVGDCAVLYCGHKIRKAPGSKSWHKCKEKCLIRKGTFITTSDNYIKF